ncbi:hypothetical protein CEXT_289291 [Caerostris extrusa]|uniref:Uncharacterized protein n=1 Tax=Caerostris extrusa TaxID=172846 RepID=A0AAV4RPX2_CAEEX|nr:hypothetical protein CEXT_289291 [Caerostris extrusa]
MAPKWPPHSKRTLRDQALNGICQQQTDLRSSVLTLLLIKERLDSVLLRQVITHHIKEDYTLPLECLH